MNTITFGTLNPNGEVSNVRVLSKADLRACPFTVLDPTHYRVDGACKCDDPVERDRMIRQWEYTRDDFRGVWVTPVFATTLDLSYEHERLTLRTTLSNGAEVSTVDTKDAGLETCIFWGGSCGDSHSDVVSHYQTEEEARIGHAEIVATLSKPGNRKYLPNGLLRNIYFDLE